MQNDDKNDRENDGTQRITGGKDGDWVPGLVHTSIIGFQDPDLCRSQAPFAARGRGLHSIQLIEQEKL